MRCENERHVRVKAPANEGVHNPNRKGMRWASHTQLTGGEKSLCASGEGEVSRETEGDLLPVAEDITIRTAKADQVMGGIA